MTIEIVSSAACVFMLFVLPHLCSWLLSRFCCSAPSVFRDFVTLRFCGLAILRFRTLQFALKTFGLRCGKYAFRQSFMKTDLSYRGRSMAVVHRPPLPFCNCAIASCVSCAWRSLIQRKCARSITSSPMHIVCVAVGYTSAFHSFLPFLHAYHCTYRCVLRTLYTLRITIFSMPRARSRREVSEKDLAACGISSCVPVVVRR